MTHALFIACRSTAPERSSQGWHPVGRLEHVTDGYRFVYTKGAQQMDGFVPFPGMPDLEAIYESSELFPLFKNRLLTPSRPEYEAFLVWGGFDPGNPPEPLAMLGVTEGRRATDRYEVFPCPEPDMKGCYVNKFFLHGLRWVSEEALAAANALKPGNALELELEDDNLIDPNAVAVYRDADQKKHRIGYVPRYLAYDVRAIFEKCSPDVMSLVVERINPDAPLQHRVLCRINACWPAGFQPCARSEFSPIVESLTSTPH